MNPPIPNRAAVVPALLFLSGLAALVYQTVWLREFRLIFGASTAASAAVLALFMAGLGAGSLRLGPRADRHTNPLAYYGRLEAWIALAASLSPLLLAAIRRLYSLLGGTETLGPAGATLLRLALAGAVLAPPTFLMGGTLPAAACELTRSGNPARRGLGLLYGANTLGAVTGTFLSTFLLIETLGNRGALWAAAALNLFVAAVALRMARPARADHEPRAEPASERPDSHSPGIRCRLSIHAVCSAAFLTGFVFLLMELVWYRMLSPLLGGSTFTFGIILAVALAGIGAGGLLYPWVFRNRNPSATAFAWTCALEALAMALPFVAGDRLAMLALALRSFGSVGFAGHVVAWIGLCALVVFPAALLAGLQFPLLIALLGGGRTSLGRDVGLAYVFNTSGAIGGSLAGGFGLMPMLSAPGVWKASVWILAALGAGSALVA